MINKTAMSPGSGLVKKGIPPAPIIFIKLLELFAKEDHANEEITRTIQKDPGLTASLLLMGNSAAFGGTMVARSVEEAVLRLGINRIRRMVTMLCAEKVIRLPKSSAYKENQLWEHSLATAIAARHLAAHLGGDENHLFTVGLLHDLGKIPMVQNVPEYPQLFLRSVNECLSLFELENEFLKVNHCDLGFAMLKQWQAPPEFYKGIQDHHQSTDTISSTIYLADKIAYQIDKGFGHPNSDPTRDQSILQSFNLPPQQILTLGQEVNDELEQTKASLQPSFNSRKT